MNIRKKLIIAALIMLGSGIIICLVALVSAGFDFDKLSSGKYVTKTYTIEDDFQDINIDVDTEKVLILPANDSSCKVVCFEDENDASNVRVDGQTLIIDKASRHKWTFYFGLVTYSPEITIYLPKDIYGELSVSTDTGNVDIPADFSYDSIMVSLATGDISCYASAENGINIETDTGDITINGVSASKMELKSDTGVMNLRDIDLIENLTIEEETGNVSIENVICRNLISTGSTGDLTLTNVTSTGEFNLKRDTGDIRFSGCDAETIYIETDTGSVTGFLLTDKVFITETDTGRVEVPKTIKGGRCEIKTGTGDIRIEIK